MSYYCLHIRGVLDAEVDEISTVCFEAGAAGVEENLAFTQPSLEYEAKEVRAKSHNLVVYFESDPASLVALLCEKFKNVEVTVTHEEDRDWLAEWKKGFHPFRIYGRYWIVPSWMKPPVDAEQPLIIDPGMAFGTGTHATTQLCAKMIVNEISKHGFASAIDVGTGTGILAMIARYEGAKKVVAIDNDSEALRVARENLALNKIHDIEVSNQSLAQIEGSFDIVVANIIDGVLLKLKPDLLRLLKPGGRLVLGGILLERDPEFIPLFLEKTHLEVIDRELKDEWVSYTLG
jgi:ribosomal protein L11 methyltransferase